MGIFLNAAYTVLQQEGKPLSVRIITQLAQSKGLLKSEGQTPWQTMKSKLSTDILRRGESSLFMRSAEGRFALREWESVVPEYKADRYQKALFDEDIVVFPASSLRDYVPGVGLFGGPIDSRALRAELKPMRRRFAENDATVIQLVSVFVVRHANRVLTHKRTKRLPESRLHGYYSLSFGGHLNPDDISPLFDIFDPQQGMPWLVRELREELILPAPPHLICRGLLYDDSRQVSRQHLGIVYDILVPTEEFKIGERGFLVDAKFEPMDSIRRRRAEFENWSLLLLQHLGSKWE